MKKQHLMLALAGTLIVAACEKRITSDKDKLSYTIGTQFARNLKQQNIDVDGAAIGQAISDVMAGKKGAMTDEEMQQAMVKMNEQRQKEMQKDAEANLKKSQAWLEDNKKKEGVKTTPSGLQIKIIEEGKGASPKENDTVVVNYKGVEVINNSEFDSSYKRNRPEEFPLKGVIPGWTEGLQMLKKGAKAQLYIPPNLAYGDRPRPGIPANAALVFDVELLDVKPPSKGAAAPKATPKKK
jgi:FKBP-type peptidyl-prolyl cis-trans isomerase FkpA/FKBP-type peptidyl-prolyl cis-trans isomerase FklB